MASLSTSEGLSPYPGPAPLSRRVTFTPPVGTDLSEETPEGPTAASSELRQGVELSTGVEDYEDVKRMLLDLEVVPVGGRYE